MAVEGVRTFRLEGVRERPFAGLRDGTAAPDEPAAGAELELVENMVTATSAAKIKQALMRISKPAEMLSNEILVPSNRG